MNTTVGTLDAATTQPSAEAESSMSSTAKASATPAIDEPARFTTWPMKK